MCPSNWKSKSKKNLKVEWYVQCNFFDPAFEKEYPKGFPFRKRANKPKTIEERQALIKELSNIMLGLLEEGYNPITDTFMGKVDNEDDINENTPVLEALHFVLNKKENNSTKKDLISVLKYFEIAVKRLHFEHIKISEIKKKHIKFCLEYLLSNPVIEVKGKKNKKTGKYDNITYHKLPDKRYNKYIAYLSILFKYLLEYDVIEVNPCHNISKRPVIRELTKVLSINERNIVKSYLSSDEKFSPFLRFINIFFHSGGRIIELLRLKVKDVDLEAQRYKTIIKKGKVNREVWKAIKTIALPFWEEAIYGADSEAFIFHKGLTPGIAEKPLSSDAVNRRWKRHIKDKLDIECNLNSLRHLNLDEVTAILSIKDAANMASHTNTRMMENHYAVGEAQRQFERIKNLNNVF